MRDPQGIESGWSLLKLTARDMAKLGQLYLDKGQWKGQQVVPADWVAASTRPHSQPPGVDKMVSYGYQWWISLTSDHPSYAAIGYGGQRILVCT